MKDLFTATAQERDIIEQIATRSAHLNRRTGKLEDLFSPRFSRKKEAS